MLPQLLDACRVIFPPPLSTSADHIAGCSNCSLHAPAIAATRIEQGEHLVSLEPGVNETAALNERGYCLIQIDITSKAQASWRHSQRLHSIASWGASLRHVLQFIGPDAEIVKGLSIYNMADSDFLAATDRKAQYRKTAQCTDPSCR